MKFELVKDKEKNKYVWLKEVELEQDLISAYDIKNKKFLVLDEDEKDYNKQEYKKFIEVNINGKDKKLGIVQEIEAEKLIAVSEILIKVMNLYA